MRKMYLAALTLPARWPEVMELTRQTDPGATRGSSIALMRYRPAMRHLLVGWVMLTSVACGISASVCDATTCSGCCSASGSCEPGGASDACGSGGAACSDCSSQSRSCVLFQCSPAQGTGGGTGGGSATGGGAATGGGSDSCAGVTCTQAPRATCVDANTIRLFEAAGTCRLGQCEYASRTETCVGGCANDVCNTDPCNAVSCVSPPASTCRDAATRRSFEAQGTCANGACTYAPQDFTCPFGCANGACIGDPCIGVTCQTPPAALCLNASTRRSFQSSGTCGAGTCTYASQDTTCAFGCAAGACNPDPCLNVSCTTPPAATCVNGTTRRSFTSPGTCALGTCSYSAAETACAASETCQAGACTWDDATLSGLAISPGTIPFTPGQTTYFVTVPTNVSSVALTATVSQPTRATIRVNTNVVTSGTASNVSLSGAVTPVTVQVVAESGASASYTVVVTRGGSIFELSAFNDDVNRAEQFGASVAMSADGSTLVIGDPGENANGIGINPPSSCNVGACPACSCRISSGAAYVFRRGPSGWTQQAYLKASNTRGYAAFGRSVALSADGNTLAVGADGEDSASTGINGDQSTSSLISPGATYVFVRSGSTWSQQAYVKASNTRSDANFGWSVGLSADGNTLAVGAPGETSNATGVNGNQANTSLTEAGAVYVFARAGTSWSQQAYVKASNTAAEDLFGTALALSRDGNTLAVGAIGEDSAAVGVGGDQSSNASSNAGAVYTFTRAGTVWTPAAYVKASNTDANDAFGTSLALNADGTRLAVGAPGEDSSATGVNGSQTNQAAGDGSGAVYVFSKSGAAWSQQAYVKALNPGAGDLFGTSVAFDSTGDVLAVGSPEEDGEGSGINPPVNNDESNAGAVYLFHFVGSAWAQQAYVKMLSVLLTSKFGVAVSLSTDGSILVGGASGLDRAAVVVR